MWIDTKAERFETAQHNAANDEIVEFSKLEEKLYTYAIMRNDIHMPPGKLGSQIGHVCSQSLIQYLHINPHMLPKFARLSTSGSRIVLSGKLDKILKARDEAVKLGLPHFLFFDSGHILPPDFTGEPIITGLGIGPATKEEMRSITKKFQLWRDQ